MREKTLRAVVSFHTTTDAMAVEAWCTEHGVPGRLIPLPPVISAGCGMCWSAPAAEERRVAAAVGEAGVAAAGYYQMML